MGKSWRALFVMLAGAVSAVVCFPLGAAITDTTAKTAGALTRFGIYSLFSWASLGSVATLVAGIYLASCFDHDWTWEKRVCGACERKAKQLATAHKEVAQLREALIADSHPACDSEEGK